MILDTSIKGARESAQKLIDSINSMELAEKPLFSCNFSFSMTPRIVINNIRDLNACRRWMGKNLGIKKFLYQMRWFSCGSCLTSWKSLDSLWEIWLRCSIEDYPEELVEGTCRWEKITERVEETYEYVCEINK